MKKNFLALAVLCAITSGAAFAQQAAEGSLMVRARAVHIDSADKDSTGLGLSLRNKTIPEVDISYFFTPNLAAELILTYPQKHDLRSNGDKIGSLKHLPPTLLAQYHFTELGSFKPYVGAGINFTRFSSVRFDPAVQDKLNPSIDSNSWGGALQVGFDVPLSDNLYLTDVFSAGNKIGEFKVNPVLVGAGVGWRF